MTTPDGHNPPASRNSVAPISFPVALRLNGKKCLLVGSAGETANRARNLIAAGAELVVVSEKPDEDTLQLHEQGRLTLHARPFHCEDLVGCWLVVLADMAPALAAQIGALCEERQVFFCAIDQPGPSSFSHVAQARAGSLFAAIGTDGAAPALAARLRKELQRIFDESNLVQLVTEFTQLRKNTPPESRRTTLLCAAERVRFNGKITVD